MGGFDKFVKKVVGKKVYNTANKVVNTKTLAVVSPYTAVLTTAGRAQVKSLYGGALAGVANTYSGGQAGPYVAAALEALSPTPPDESQGATVFSDVAPATASGTDSPYESTSPNWLLPAFLGLGAIAAILIWRR